MSRYLQIPVLDKKSSFKIDHLALWNKTLSVIQRTIKQIHKNVKDHTHFFQEALSCLSRHRKEGKVFSRVEAKLLEVRQDFIFAFVVSEKKKEAKA